VSSGPGDFSDLRAMFINCTLKRAPEVSNTQGLAIVPTGRTRRHVSPARSTMRG